MAEVDRIHSDARESVFIATDFPGHGACGIAGATARTSAIENRKAERIRRGHPLSVQVSASMPQAARRRCTIAIAIPAGRST